MATTLNYCPEQALRTTLDHLVVHEPHRTAGQSRRRMPTRSAMQPRRGTRRPALAQCEVRGAELQERRSRRDSLRISRLADNSLRLTWDPAVRELGLRPAELVLHAAAARKHQPAVPDDRDDARNLFFVDTTAVGSNCTSVRGVIPTW